MEKKEVKEKKRCPFCGANYFCVDWMVGQYFWFDKQGVAKEDEMDWGGDYSAVYCGECEKEIPGEIWEKWDINLCPCDAEIRRELKRNDQRRDENKRR